MTDAVAIPSRCRNCDFDLGVQPGRYCSNCGQETAPHVPTAGEFLHEFVGHYVALEGRLAKTLWLLFLKPGLLTKEYFAGKRRRYVLPLRLYLTASIVFFMLVKVLGVGNLVKVQETPDKNTKEAISQAQTELTKAGIILVAAAGGGSRMMPMKPFNETTLLGGDSVMVFLSRGDVQIGAAGTVTLRDGEKIYAFGHPFFSLGSANLPMTESHVITVIPNANNSFKLAVADSMVGAMTQDRATAIYGKLGEQPRMLPVKIKLTNSRGRVDEVNFETAFDDLLTPLIVNAGIANTLSAQERGLGDITVEMTGEVKIKGHDSIRLNRRFTGGQALALASSSVAGPLSAMLRANFDGLEITGINLNLTSRDGSRSGSVDRLAIDKNSVRPGETIELTVFEKTTAGKFNTRKIPLTIPADTAPGNITITVGDGNAVQQNAAITQFTPHNTAELIATINRLKRPDRLYAVLTRTTTGTIIGSSEMPNLPPSMLATLNNDRTAGGSKPSVQTILSEIELPPGEYILTGSQTLNIEVIR